MVGLRVVQTGTKTFRDPPGLTRVRETDKWLRLVTKNATCLPISNHKVDVTTANMEDHKYIRDTVQLICSLQGLQLPGLQRYNDVVPFYRESALRTLQSARFCLEEVPHDEGQLFAMHTKTFPQVSPIDRAPQLHFSTLEKTKIDHDPLVYNLVLTVAQVSPFYRHLKQIFQDLDIHTRSSPGLLKLKMTRPKAFLRSNSSWVVIWL